MSMALPGRDILCDPDEDPLDGWKEIATFVGFGEKQSQRLAMRYRDPLPVRRYVNRVYAWPSELRAWGRRQSLPYQTARLLDAIDTKKACPKMSGGGSRKR